MTELKQTDEVDFDKLMAFVFRAVDEVGSTLNAALVVMGDKLGLYRAMAELRAHHAEPPGRRHRHRRAVRPGVAQRPGRRRHRRLRPRDRPLHAAARAGRRVHRRDQSGVPPGLLPDRARHRAGLRQDRRAGPQRCRLRLARAQPRRARGLRAVLPARATTPTWSASGCPRWTASCRSWSGAPRSPTSAAATAPRPSSWRRRSRGRPSTARTTTRSRSTTARARAEEAGVADRVTFEVAGSAGFGGPGYDLVTTFDALHDMGDPVGAARAVRAPARRGRHLDDRRADGR